MEWSPGGVHLAAADAADDGHAKYNSKTAKASPFTSSKNVVRVWDVATGRQKLVLRHRRIVGPIQGHDYFRFDVAWRPDGKRIVTCLNSNENWSSPLQIWETVTGRRVRELGGPASAPTAPAWKPDSKRLAASGGGIVIWDPASGEQVRTLSAFDWPEAIAWSPDGKYVAARNHNDWYGYASDNVASIPIWRIVNGETVAELRQKGEFLEGPAWSPDGTRLACAAGDGTLRVWDLSLLVKTRPDATEEAIR